MKRYTLTFQPLSPLIQLDHLRKEVDELLLKLHPRITYKMGQVFTSLDGHFLAEIAMEGKRQLLMETLKSNVWVAPVQFQGLSWGWTNENEGATSQASARSPIEVDPLAMIVPLEGVREFHLSKRKLRGRYILLMLSTLVMILVLIINTIHPRSPLFEGLYLTVLLSSCFRCQTRLSISAYMQKRLPSIKIPSIFISGCSISP